MATRPTKYVFVTGGVLSGLGKGITAASIGNLLKARGLKVNLQKCDPYLNVDAGLLNPREMFQPTPEEVEALAIQEHNLWMQAMEKLGWQKGDAYNLRDRLNPNLVPWEQLDEGTREYDRNIIRRLPYVLAKADYKVELAGTLPGEPAL